MSRILSTFFLVMLLAVTTNVLAKKMPQVSAGKLIIVGDFSSNYVSPRLIRIWLPDGYDANKAGHYATLYMHDGQMLFDAKTTWNGQEWGVDEMAQQLINGEKTRPFIVVGVDTGGANRHSDYYPQKPFESLTKQQQASFYQLKRSPQQALFAESVNSDNYLKFLVKELKPYIDSHYAVNPAPEATFVMGSSMGGLISMYAISEYPDVFGGAACLSTHWPGIMPDGIELDFMPATKAFYQYIQQTIPAPKSHKIYFDYGDKTLDAYYPPLQQKVDAIMQAKGYNESLWQTLFFPGQNHSENAWRSRLGRPMMFLLGK